MPKYEWSSQGIGEWLRDKTPSDAHIAVQGADIRATLAQLIEIDRRAADRLVTEHAESLWLAIHYTDSVPTAVLQDIQDKVSRAWVQAVYGRKET